MPEHSDEIDDPIPTPVEFDLFRPEVSQAEAQRALLVRAGFMAALLTDSRVIRRLSDWLVACASMPSARWPARRRPGSTS
jgi:hypothetical protein